LKLIIRFKGGSGSGNFGHAGRKGEVGGSASGAGTQSIPLDLFGVRPITPNDVPIPAGVFSSDVYPMEASWRDREKIYNDLSEDTGIDAQTIAAVSKVGNFGSLYTSYAGTHVIEALSNEFDIPLDDWEKTLIAQKKAEAKTIPRKWIRDDYRANGYSEYDRPLKDSDMDKLVQAVYNRTQSELNARGIESVKLYRGSDVGAHENVISSYTTDRKVAEGFGTVKESIIPASRIWALPSTGFGVNVQLEVLVLDVSADTE